jgi:hypothetical protein
MHRSRFRRTFCHDLCAASICAVSKKAYPRGNLGILQYGLNRGCVKGADYIGKARERRNRRFSSLCVFCVCRKTRNPLPQLETGPIYARYLRYIGSQLHPPPKWGGGQSTSRISWQHTKATSPPPQLSPCQASHPAVHPASIWNPQSHNHHTFRHDGKRQPPAIFRDGSPGYSPRGP